MHFWNIAEISKIVHVYMYVSVYMCVVLSVDVCEMLEKEKQQLQDWEARHAFVQEFSSSVKVWGSPTSPVPCPLSLLHSF